MDKKKKTEAPVDSDPKGPIKSFLLDDVSASVFVREHETQYGKRTYYSVSFSRSYRDSKGERRYVKTFNIEDLGKVITVAQQSDAYIRELMAQTA